MGTYTAQISGTVVKIEELRNTGSKQGNSNGTDVLNLNIAVNHQIFNERTKKWDDNGVTFQRAVIWNWKAVKTAQNIQVGDPILVTGKLTTGLPYKDKDGNNRTPQSVLTVETIGFDFTLRDIEVDRSKKGGSKSKSTKTSKATESNNSQSEINDLDDDFLDDDFNDI